MIVRPPEYLDDVRERELEMQAAEARLAELGYHLCPHCDYEVREGLPALPDCMRKLQGPVPLVRTPARPGVEGSPFCEAEIALPARLRDASAGAARARRSLSRAAFDD